MSKSQKNRGMAMIHNRQQVTWFCSDRCNCFLLLQAPSPLSSVPSRGIFIYLAPAMQEAVYYCIIKCSMESFTPPKKGVQEDALCLQKAQGIWERQPPTLRDELTEVINVRVSQEHFMNNGLRAGSQRISEQGTSRSEKGALKALLAGKLDLEIIHSSVC